MRDCVANQRVGKHQLGLTPRAGIAVEARLEP